jgi:hypothetical protein
VSALVAFLNLFLGAYLLDAGLSLLDALLHLGGHVLLTAPRDWLASVVLTASFLLLLVTLLSPRLPKRVLLPLALGTPWLNLGAPPLGGWLVDPLHRDVALSLVQLALAAPPLLWVRRRSAGTAWLFEERLLLAGRSRRVLLVATAVVLGLPVLLALVGVGAGVVLVKRATGGFVGFAAHGLTLDERHYRRGDREVRLIGMSHVGRKGIYEALLAQDDGTPTLILEEGVSDMQGLLPRTGYQEPLALALGLDAQPPAAEMLGPGAGEDGEESAAATPALENADLDLSTFRPSTIEFLRLAFRLNADPADPEARRGLGALVRAHDSRELYGGLVEDVLTKRNEHLLARIDQALESHPRVVVPWGALHLAGVEAGLLARGFELASSEPRSFLPYDALARAVTRSSQP